MKQIDLAYAHSNLFAHIWRLIKSRRSISKQRTFCWCPVCKEDLCSNNSFISDTDLVRYDCSNCATISYWNFDFSSPVIVKVEMPKSPSVLFFSQ